MYAPKADKAGLAAKYAAQRSRMLVAMKMDTISGRVSGLWTETPSFGWWVPVAVKDDDTAKALATWWNSTPARLMLLNRRARKLTYPMWQVAHLREIRIPKPENPAWQQLRDTFEQVKNIELLPMRDAEQCPARRVIEPRRRKGPRRVRRRSRRVAPPDRVRADREQQVRADRAAKSQRRLRPRAPPTTHRPENQRIAFTTVW